MLLTVAAIAYLALVVIPALDAVTDQVQALKRERELLDMRDANEGKHAETIDLLRRRQLDNEAKLLLLQEQNRRLAGEVGRTLKGND